MRQKYGKTNTFEVRTLRGGTFVATRNREKAADVFADICRAFPDQRVYFQVWNGARMVSEQIGNNDKAVM